ncbi:MAG: PBP1A family penicillin-binding protein [Thermoanaerobaculia bacterium]|nr:PBP1A family penicillin-binding protein [Thermoanaerobaculia bacterium]
MTEEANRKPRRRGIVIRILLLFLVVVLGIPSGLLLARMINRPLVEKLHSYRPDVITRLHDVNGEVFAEYSIQKRIVVPKDEMSEHFINAVIATEDARFEEHGGLDPKSILRALIKDLLAGEKVQGASTITQQLARQVFLTPEKSWKRKINEAFLAVDIEKNFTKDQIFEMYSNQVYLGHGAYGVEAASRLYFGKRSEDLTLPEAALLAGMIQRPSAYSPINHPDRILTRRNYVLRRMEIEGYITREQRDQAIRTPILLSSWEEDTPDVGAYFAEEVRQKIQKEYGTDDLYRGGLDVHTTLDIRIQRAAEESLREGLRAFDRKRGFRDPERNILEEGLEPAQFSDPSWDANLAQGRLYPAVVESVEGGVIHVHFDGETLELGEDAYGTWTKGRRPPSLLERGDVVHVRFELDEEENRVWSLEQMPEVQGAVVVIEVDSGEVRGLVGGYDFDTSKFNRAVQSVRQTGSAFKPFVYGAAFEKGYTPADTVFDAPIEIPVGNDTYAPRNYTGTYEGIITLQRALELSINIPAVKLLSLVTVESVIDFARRAGISSKLDPYPSLALGAAGAPPLQMAEAYNTFANRGVHIRPRMIESIEDSTGKTLFQSYPEISEGTSEQVAYVLTHTMQAVVRRGTGYAAHTLPGVHAGKTGTTNGYTDAWFIGFSPEYTVAVWVGYDDPQRSLGRGATGAEVALPIWIDTFRKMDEAGLRDEPAESFPVPGGVVLVPFDLKTGRRGGSELCGRVVRGAFINGTQPDRDCSGEPANTLEIAAVTLPEPGGTGETPATGVDGGAEQP